ncbi:MAG: hypothetical protein AAF745_11525, partial [Planctomycetota bacterium]
MIVLSIGLVQLVLAQPPGTLPPASWLEGDVEGIKPEAFLFLDESRTPVVVPRMSFEEIDRLRRTQSNQTQAAQVGTLKSCDIDAVVRGQRALLTVRLIIRVEERPSGPIDLGFSGFHLLRPATVSGLPGAWVRLKSASLESNASMSADESQRRLRSDLTGAASPSPDLGEVNQPNPTGSSSLASSTLGYELAVPARPNDAVVDSNPGGDLDSARECAVEMVGSVRVRRPLPRSYLMPLVLPTTPTTARITIHPESNPADSTNGPSKNSFSSKQIRQVRVLGDGRESLSRDPDHDQTKGSVSYQLQCDGGAVALSWQQVTSRNSVAALLDVQCDAIVQWDAPEKNPIVDATIAIQNLRGGLDAFQMELPYGSILLGSPELVATSSDSSNGLLDNSWQIDVQSDTSIVGSRAMLDDDMPIELELTDAPTTVAVRVRLQLPAPNPDKTRAWALSLPKVAEAISGRATVAVTTSPGYRVRWQRRAGIEAMTGSATDDSEIEPLDAGNDSISRVFRLDRLPLTLPIWLSSQRQRNQIDVLARVQVRGSLPDVTPDDFNENGESIDGRYLANDSYVDRVADLTLQIDGRGGLVAQDLRIDPGDWQITGLQSPTVATPIETIADDNWLAIDLDSASSQPVERLILTAVRTWSVDISKAGATEALAIPRVVCVEPSSVLRDVEIEVDSIGQSQWIIDLPASSLVQKTEISSLEIDDQRDGNQTNRYRLLALDGAWQLTGSLKQTPLELKLSGAIDLAGTADDWTCTSRWRVEPSIDLDGQLDFALGPAGGCEVSVDGQIASIQTLSKGRRRIISPMLSKGPHRIEIVVDNPLSIESPASSTMPATPADDASTVLTPPIRRSIAASREWSVTLPRLLADRVRWSEPISLQLPRSYRDDAGRPWQTTWLQPNLMRDWLANDRDSISESSAIQLSRIPPFDLALKSSVVPDFNASVSIPRAWIRSVTSSQTRFEQLSARVRGGGLLRLGLDPAVIDASVEATHNGRPIPIVRDRDGLTLDLPDRSSGTSRIDLRIWSTVRKHPWWSTVRPLIRLPIRSGWIYWDVVVPSDSHLVWAGPSLGRAMRWQREPMRMRREAMLSPKALDRWVKPTQSPQAKSVAAEITPDQPSFGSGGFGNRYLFYGSDTQSLSMVAISRTSLWLITGGLIIALLSTLHLLPRWRTPTVAVALAIALIGLLVIAPDSVVLAGQLLMLSMIWVAVFYTIASLVSPKPRGRVLSGEEGLSAAGGDSGDGAGAGDA